MAEELAEISMTTKSEGGMITVNWGVRTDRLVMTPDQALVWAKLLWNEAYLAMQQAGRTIDNQLADGSIGPAKED